MSALSLQDSIHEWESEQGATDATMLAAQFEVIAEELKTANLLAVLHGPSTLDVNYADLKQQIIERMGLK